MNIKLNQRLALTVIALVAIVALPLVSSYFYFTTLPVTVTNNDNNTSYSVTLLAFGDTNGSCIDSDNGVKPDSNNGGFSIWTDINGGNNNYSYNEWCDTNSTLVELACANHIKVNGIQYPSNYIGAFRVNCPSIGYSTCNATTRRCQ